MKGKTIIRHYHQLLIGVGVFVCLFALLIRTHAQQLDCSNIVKAALQETGDRCSQIGRGKACYGNGLVVANANDGVSSQDFTFHAPGDQVNVEEIKALRLASFDPSQSATDEQWGVVYLRIQANFPDTGGQYVTMMLYGDADLQNAVQAVSTASGANSALNAVYFQTGAGSPTCHNAPTSGLVIQTPHNAGPVSMTVNGVKLGVSSTVFIEAPSSDLDSRYPFGRSSGQSPGTEPPTLTPVPSSVPGASHRMRIATLQGHVTIAANGYAKTIGTGQQSDVTLNDQGDEPDTNGDPIEDVTTIDPQDNPDLTVADGTDDSLLAPLPTDEATTETAVTETPEITDTQATSDTPEMSDTPQISDTSGPLEATNTPESGNTGSSEALPTPTQGQSQSDNQSNSGDATQP